MNLLPAETGSAMVKCESFGDECSFLVAAESGPARKAFGDVVPDPSPRSRTRGGCPECGNELVRVERGL